MVQNNSPSPSPSLTENVHINVGEDDIIGSINGLTCIQTSYVIRICNPSTHEILCIPYPELEFLHLCMYGFGFDPLMNVYKVLRVDCDDSVFQIFTLGAKTQDCIWRDVKVTSHLPSLKWDMNTFEYPFIFSSGALFRVFPRTNTIIMFDIHYEKFQVITGLQVSCDGRLRLYSICELQGSPYAVYCADLMDVYGYEFSLCALKKQPSGSNSNVGSIHFVFEQAVRIPFQPKTDLIRFDKFSGQMLLLWFSLWDGHSYVYNSLKKNLRKKVSRMPPGWYVSRDSGLVVKHIENLHSLKKLVPQSMPGARLIEVRYLSSREAML